MTKKIISFSLWGNDAKYTIGAIKNAELAPLIYPDFEAHFYIGTDVDRQVRVALAQLAKVTEMPPGNWNSMFWRFAPANDPDTIMISRDTDSRLNLREKAAVDAWLASDKDFHIMRDHPYHRTEILGGMWGARNDILTNKISPLMEAYPKGNFYQVDQNFLREKIYPLVKDNALVHDPFFEGRLFPTIRRPGEYVGKAFYGDDREFDLSLNLLVQGVP